MKKIKMIVTYFIAILCVCITLIQPNDQMIIQTSVYSDEDRIMIFVLKENDIIPITLKQKKKKTIEENIIFTFELMKKGIELNNFQSIIPKSIQLLDVVVKEKNVKLNFNEAIYSMNSRYELRFIEAIVNSILQFNEEFKIQFYANDELIDYMPLSNRKMKIFDKTIGINNFKLVDLDLYNTSSKKVIKFIEDETYSYHTIQTIRSNSDISLLEFINDYLSEQNYLLNCEKIENLGDTLVLHLNENFLYDENTINYNEVIHLLYTLRINDVSNQFILKVNTDEKYLQGYSTQLITINDLFLNIFEE